MDSIFKTLDQGFIKYKNNTINIIVDENEMIFFNAKETASALGYKSHIDAIKQHTNKKDRMQLQFINSDNKSGHPHSLYLTEAGLYKLILRSKLPSAEKFSEWVTYDVLPSIRKYGYYKLNEENKQLIKQLNIKIKRLSTMKQNADNTIKTLQQDLKKEKFPKGGLVYAIDFSTKKEQIYRIGMTTNMNRRKEVINTHTLNKQPVAFYLETKSPRTMENCIRSLLYDFRYKDRKDFYICSLKRIKLAFSSCEKGSKKVNYPGKSGSNTSHQRGGSIKLPNTNIISHEIINAKSQIVHINKKINKLNKLIHN